MSYGPKVYKDNNGDRLNVAAGGVINTAAGTRQSGGVAMSDLKWVDVAVTAALLDGAGSVPVVPASTTDQYKVRNIRLVGGGTNFGSGGDRLIGLTDGTTTWTTVANADIESAPAATLDWGNSKVPFLTGTSDVVSAAGAAIGFKYSGGTTDHSGTGSIKFSVCLEKVAYMAVVATDDFASASAGLDSPYAHAAVVTKDDSNELTKVTRALFVGGAGNLAVVTVGGETVTITGVAAGSILRLRVKQVLSTNTTATNVVALW